MPQYSRRDLDVRAREYGFNRDIFRKPITVKTVAVMEGFCSKNQCIDKQGCSKGSV